MSNTKRILRSLLEDKEKTRILKRILSENENSEENSKCDLEFTTTASNLQGEYEDKSDTINISNDISNSEFGRGRGFGKRLGNEPTSTCCICPNCGYKKEKTLEIPCIQEKCPKCGSIMVREGSFHDKLYNKE
jgi:hypothetical protein